MSALSGHVSFVRVNIGIYLAGNKPSNCLVDPSLHSVFITTMSTSTETLLVSRLLVSAPALVPGHGTNHSKMLEWNRIFFFVLWVVDHSTGTKDKCCSHRFMLLILCPC